MDDQPHRTYRVDSEDGLSPRRSDSVDSLSSVTPKKNETPFLCSVDEDVYEHRPLSTEDASTAKIVASIYDERAEEIRASTILQSLEDMALHEGREVSALCEARLQALEKLLDPDNVDPVITRNECTVALQRWGQNVVLETADDDSFLVSATDIARSNITVSNGIGPVFKYSLSPCCHRVSSEEVAELRHQNKMLQKTIDTMQFQLATTEKKLSHLKDEKSRLMEEARVMRTGLDKLQGFKQENELLESDNSKLNAHFITLKEDLSRLKKDKSEQENKLEVLSEKNNKLVSKLEECTKSESLIKISASRQHVHIRNLKAAIEDLQKDLHEKEEENKNLWVSVQKYEERVAELTTVKARLSSSPESDYNDNVVPAFNIDDLDSTTQVLTPTPSCCHKAGSLFAELMSANEEARKTQTMTPQPPKMEDSESQTDICDLLVDTPTSYKYVSVDNTTQTMQSQSPETKDRESQTGKWDKLVMYEADQSGQRTEDHFKKINEDVSNASEFLETSYVIVEADQFSGKESHETRDATTQTLGRIELMLPFGIVSAIDRQHTQYGPEQTEYYAKIDDTYVSSGDAPNAEIARKRGCLLACGLSNRVGHCDKILPEQLNASTMTSPDVDGSGDASHTPSSGQDALSSGVFDALVRRTSRSNSFLRTARLNRPRTLLKHLGSNRRRRNDAQAALDREMALLECEVFEVSRGARKQCMVVSKAMERALEAAEEYGRVVQEQSCMRVTEGKTRSVGTWTNRFLLCRNASEPLLKRRSVRAAGRSRPSVRRIRAGVKWPRVRLFSPPPPTLPSTALAPRDEEVPTTRPLLGHNWRFVTCFIFIGLTLIMAFLVMWQKNQDCRYSRYRQSYFEKLIGFLRAHNIIQVKPGPRPC